MIALKVRAQGNIFKVTLYDIGFAFLKDSLSKLFCNFVITF